MAPVLGAVADARGPRRPWILIFSALYVVGAAGLWGATPGLADLTPVLAFLVVALIGAEFTSVFTNSLLPELGTKGEIGRISGSGWAMGLKMSWPRSACGRLRRLSTRCCGRDPGPHEFTRNVDNSVSRLWEVCEIKLNLCTRNSLYYELSACPFSLMAQGLLGTRKRQIVGKREPLPGHEPSGSGFGGSGPRGRRRTGGGRSRLPGSRLGGGGGMRFRPRPVAGSKGSVGLRASVFFGEGCRSLPAREWRSGSGLRGSSGSFARGGRCRALPSLGSGV